MRGRRVSVLVAVATLAATACAGSAARERSAGSDGNGASLKGSITVLAAASLTDSFQEAGRLFRAAHPGVDVTFSFDASSTLVRQAMAGAPADVLATADEVTMEQAQRAGVVTEPRVFAHNRLAILVARGNPRNVRSLADLTRPGVVAVLCAAEVPCGRSGAQALERAGVQVQPRSLEPNVKGVVSKVTLGEADGGIVYVTDVKAAGDKVEGVDIPAAHNVVAAYPTARLESAPNPAVADAFIAFLLSDEGRAVLARAGFEP